MNSPIMDDPLSLTRTSGSMGTGRPSLAATMSMTPSRRRMSMAPSALSSSSSASALPPSASMLSKEMTAFQLQFDQWLAERMAGWQRARAEHVSRMNDVRGNVSGCSAMLH